MAPTLTPVPAAELAARLAYWNLTARYGIEPLADGTLRVVPSAAPGPDLGTIRVEPGPEWDLLAQSDRAGQLYDLCRDAYRLDWETVPAPGGRPYHAILRVIGRQPGTAPWTPPPPDPPRPSGTGEIATAPGPWGWCRRCAEMPAEGLWQGVRECADDRVRPYRGIICEQCAGNMEEATGQPGRWARRLPLAPARRKTGRGARGTATAPRLPGKRAGVAAGMGAPARKPPPAAVLPGRPQ